VIEEYDNKYVVYEIAGSAIVHDNKRDSIKAYTHSLKEGKKIWEKFFIGGRAGSRQVTFRTYGKSYHPY